MITDEICRAYPELKKEDISFLLCEILDVSASELTLVQEIPEDKRAILKGYLKELGQGRPPQYITNTAYFYGLRLYVDERVLIPRFDTEPLVEAILPYLKGEEKVLEIGVGSGAISIALRARYPALDIHATDISEGALEVAILNASKYGGDIKFHLADLFPVSERGFALIISNPPYIPSEEYQKLDKMVKDYEPKSALLAKNKGLAVYHKILKKAPLYLQKKGLIAFEHGATQQKELALLTEKASFKILQMGKDLALRDRFIIAEYYNKRG